MEDGDEDEDAGERPAPRSTTELEASAAPHSDAMRCTARKRSVCGSTRLQVSCCVRRAGTEHDHTTLKERLVDKYVMESVFKLPIPGNASAAGDSGR